MSRLPLCISSHLDHTMSLANKRRIWSNGLRAAAPTCIGQSVSREGQNRVRHCCDGIFLGGHFKSGHTWSLKNRPMGLAEDRMVFPSHSGFKRPQLLADDFVYVPCYLR